MAAYPEHGSAGGRPGYEGAAKSWAKLTPEEWEPAIAGAAVEAKTRQGEETRYTKWPQGWLSERRWLHLGNGNGKGVVEPADPGREARLQREKASRAESERQYAEDVKRSRRELREAEEARRRAGLSVPPEEPL